MIDPVREFEEEALAGDRGTRVVVLFGGDGPSVLEEAGEESRDETTSGRWPGGGSREKGERAWTER